MFLVSKPIFISRQRIIICNEQCHYTHISTKKIIFFYTGSGIYAGKSGPIKTYHPFQTSNALLVAEIPKLNRRQRIEDIHAGKSTVHKFRQAEVPTISGIPPKANLTPEMRDDLRPYTSALIQTGEASSHITTLCDRGLCCDFHVETSYDKEVAKKPRAKQYRWVFLILY